LVFFYGFLVVVAESQEFSILMRVLGEINACSAINHYVHLKYYYAQTIDILYLSDYPETSWKYLGFLGFPGIAFYIFQI